MRLNFDITKDEYEIVNDILCKHLSSVNIYLFGSRVKNTSRFNSDLDIALEGLKKIDKEILIDLKEQFNDSNLCFSVDIVDLNNIDKNFKKIIDEQKVRFPLKRKIPKLRFKEFSGEWEEKVLDKIATFSKGKGISKPDIDKDGQTQCIRYGQLYTQYNELIKEIVSKTNIDRDSLVLSEYGDIIIPASGETQIDIATASCVLKDNIALGGDLNIIKTKEDGVFLSYYLNNAKKFDIARLSQGISVVHLYSSQLKTLKLILPSIEEQEKIALFLNQIDTKIEQLVSKEKLLQQYKKGLMQKIFSQEIRFKEFSGEWGEKRLGELLSETKKKKVSNPEKYELLIVKLHCQGVFKSGKYPNVTENGRPYYIVEHGELLIGRQNFHNGGFGIVPSGWEGFVTSNAITHLTEKKDRCNLKFIEYYFSQYNFYKRVDCIIGGTGQKEMSKKEFNNLKVLIPSFKEQEKIANFLSLCDKKIEEVSKQLEKTKKFKKALLQQMFV